MGSRAFVLLTFFGGVACLVLVVVSSTSATTESVGTFLASLGALAGILSSWVVVFIQLVVDRRWLLMILMFLIPEIVIPLWALNYRGVNPKRPNY